MKRLSVLIIVMALLVGALPSLAQTPIGKRVTLEASDGLELVANFYLPTIGAEDPAPAILMMHHHGSKKEAWLQSNAIPPFLEAGYAVLAVDLRGHGESGWRQNWELTFDDTQRWITWLTEQPEVNPAAISIVGASIGGDLGLNVMVEDERIRTIVVLSPAVEVQGVTTDDAVAALAGRPVFLITGASDDFSREAVVTLLPLMTGNSQVRLYDTSVCCTFFFMTEPHIAESIIAWLDEYGR